MPPRIALLAVVALLACAFGPRLTGQSVEEHDYEQLDVSDVGPYEPEVTPDVSRAEQLIVDRTNQFRKKEKRAELKVNDKVQATAKAFAKYMAETGKYGHTADGRQPSERATAHGYEFCLIAENIAYQFKTIGFKTAELAEAFAEGWKNSPPHRKNMLDPDVTETGVALAQSEKTGIFFGVQMFGRPKSESIEFRVVNKTEETVRYRLDDREFPIESRYTRIHMRCRPPKLVLLESSEGEKQREIETVQPKNGERYAITSDASGNLKMTIEPTSTEPDKSNGAK